MAKNGYGIPRSLASSFIFTNFPSPRKASSIRLVTAYFTDWGNISDKKILFFLF